jgi:hypothetical protein
MKSDTKRPASPDVEEGEVTPGMADAPLGGEAPQADASAPDPADAAAEAARDPDELSGAPSSPRAMTGAELLDATERAVAGGTWAMAAAYKVPAGERGKVAKIGKLKSGELALLGLFAEDAAPLFSGGSFPPRVAAAGFGIMLGICLLSRRTELRALAPAPAPRRNGTSWGSASDAVPPGTEPVRDGWPERFRPRSA